MHGVGIQKLVKVTKYLPKEHQKASSYICLKKQNSLSNKSLLWLECWIARESFEDNVANDKIQLRLS